MICPHCKRNIRDDAVFCSYCGIVLKKRDSINDVKSETYQADEKEYEVTGKPKNKTIIIPVAAVIAAVALSVGIGLIVNPELPLETSEEHVDSKNRSLSEPDYEAKNPVALDIDESAEQEATTEKLIESSEVLNAYKELLASYDNGQYKELESFALYDLNGDGTDELLTRGGGTINYNRIWAYQNGQVEEIWFTTLFFLFDNGTISTIFKADMGEEYYTYYQIDDKLQMNQIGQMLYSSIDNSCAVAVGDKEITNETPRISWDEAQKFLQTLYGDAEDIEIDYKDNTEANRAIYF